MASCATPEKPPDQRSKSCETACSSNSSCFFQKRKPVNPLASSLRSGLSRSTGNSVRQRVLSAKLLKLKSVQNQLNDANYHLAEVIRENQALKSLQKRQDKALSKYEGTNAELPRLIQSHEEEIRFLTEKNKALRKSVKELNEQLKHKGDELQSIQEQLRHYERLDKDRHLLEREKLVEELEDVKRKLSKADSEIVVLNRKLTLESKTSRQRLNFEVAKNKQCQRDLSQALGEISRLTKLLEAKEKALASSGRRRFSTLSQRQSTSLISLSSAKAATLSQIAEDLKFGSETTPVTDVKLEPILKSKRDNNQVQNGKEYKGILKCPSENVRARLSADSRKDEDEELSQDKTSSSGSDVPPEKDFKSRPNSSQKLERLEMNLHNTMRRMEEHKHNDELNRRLGDYCLEAIDSVKNYSSVIETHKENLQHAKEDTDEIVETMREAAGLEVRLKRTHLASMDKNDLVDDKNLDFVTQILKDEVEFQRKYGNSTKNGNVKKEPAVGVNDKKKLLATLRAIDNGDSVDFESSIEKNHLVTELFGDTKD